MRKQIRKILILIAALLLFCSLTGCGSGSEVVVVNVENQENVSTKKFGEFIEIGNGLVYDGATRIVYIENYTYYAHYVYTPYYAPNGLPYKYNPETNTFEEIE